LVKDYVTHRSIDSESARRLTLVMGNPSADLDSFVSAIVFSYFHNHVSKAGDRIYIPLLNMPKTPSSDLWRLRPEFGVALRHSVERGQLQDTSASPTELQDKERQLLNEALTLHDLLNSDSTAPSILHALRPDLSEAIPSSSPQDIILVDHNALAITIPKVPSSAIAARLNFLGCIDHHVDEHFMPSNARPRIITTGIGSCTTLIVQHLRQSAIWPKLLDEAQTTAVQEVAQLALAPILIDTHNLKAKGEKCSDLDRGIALALEAEMGAEQSAMMTGTKTSWNRDRYYEPIAQAKAGSLDALTLQEILERDYKSWIEGSIEIGISSCVRPIRWLVQNERLGGVRGLVEGVKAFRGRMQSEMTADNVTFDVFLMLTPGADMGKEVVMVAFSHEAAKAIDVFEQKAGKLGLRSWDGMGHEEVYEAFEEGFGKGRFKVWWMTQKDKTRKQGAPLVREAVAFIQQ
jgi:exopolyphosphatase